MSNNVANQRRSLRASSAVAVGAVMIASLLSESKAASAQVLNGTQCKTAMGVAIATMDKYRGRLSAVFLNGFKEFAKTCDLKTRFERETGTADDDAWAEFRLKIIAIRAGSN